MDLESHIIFLDSCLYGKILSPVVRGIGWTHNIVV